MLHTKEHRSPTRYSLTPDENRALATIMKGKGQITDLQIRAQARHLGCATKPIYHLAESLSIPVILDKNRNRKEQHAGLSARDRAEKFFKSDEEIIQAGLTTELPMVLQNLIEDDPESSRVDIMEGDDFNRAVDMLAEEEDRLTAYQAQVVEREAKREAEFEDRVAKMSEHIARLEARARAAIQQTKQLRIDTRSDRDRIEDLESKCSRLERENAALEKRALQAVHISHEDRRELKESMARERRLITALQQSEVDLSHARSQQSFTQKN
ncbi:hypothetical protein ACOI1H_25230 [Loktanella sp. DJP18]|uniref:hypothetical protein n=1 Tax=Loktanella sp. DJP18 TaxID=3409788 RepID=UPI003BB7684F